jgi:hypothetical protein
MDASVTTAGDVSSLDSAPAVGLREWVLGARPVVGAIAASSLMVLACSWFAFSSGVLGRRHDVGGADPVRIGGTTPQLVGGPTRAAARPGVHGRVDVGARKRSRPAAASAEVRQRTESGPEPGVSAATGPGLASTGAPTAAVSHTTPAAAPSDASTSPAPPSVVPDDVTSNLPAPLDDLPSVPLPPPPATVPDLSVPAVPAVPTSIGVP